MRNTNLAYDLSIYETAHELPQKNKVTKFNDKKVIKARAKFGLARKIWNIMSVAILLSLIIGIIATNAAITSYNSSNNILLNSITSLENEQRYLEIKLESRANLTEVDEYATNVLGLTKRENSQVQYIELAEENVIEIKDLTIKEKINNVINPIMSYLLP